MRNEVLALRQHLAQVYAAQAETSVQRFESSWTQIFLAIPQHRLEQRDFPELLKPNAFESAVLLDEHDQPLYPSLRPNGESLPGLDELLSERYMSAEQFSEADWQSLCSGLDKEGRVPLQLAAQAYQGWASWHVGRGEKQKTIALLKSSLLDKRFESVLDPRARLIQPNAQLLFVRLGREVQDTSVTVIVEGLERRLNSYDDPRMASPQRLFLMRELLRIAPHTPEFPTLDAEAIANAYIEVLPRELPKAGAFQPTGAPGIWAIRVPGKPVILLARTERLQSGLLSSLNRSLGGGAVRSTVLEPKSRDVGPVPAIVRMPAGQLLPDWTVVLRPIRDDAFAQLASRRTALYYWGAMIAIALVATGTLLLGHVLLRELRLTRLKNDLISTVSHELKTPLTSIRALVESLLTDNPTPQEQREYLELVAKENKRLTRLIENFLTFSRMERGQHSFQLRELELEAVVHEAISAAGERFESMGDRFKIEIDPNLPSIRGDHDALATAVLNLLENAYKYSGEDRTVALGVQREQECVSIRVSDNGIGISQRDQKRIFDRFFQADQSLSRGASGCGLGLSIVRFIVTAHEGSINVRSELGKGSTFTIRLPAARDRSYAAETANARPVQQLAVEGDPVKAGGTQHAS